MKPTRDDILKEPAGPQMDTWVALHCLGWVRVTSVYSDTAMVIDPELAPSLLAGVPGHSKPFFREPKASDKLGFAARNYSTDISQAIGAAKEMMGMMGTERRRGRLIGFEVGEYGGRSFARLHTDRLSGLTEHGDTEEHALCRALLLAVIG